MGPIWGLTGGQSARDAKSTRDHTTPCDNETRLAMKLAFQAARHVQGHDVREARAAPTSSRPVDACTPRRAAHAFSPARWRAAALLASTMVATPVGVAGSAALAAACVCHGVGLWSVDITKAEGDGSIAAARPRSHVCIWLSAGVPVRTGVRAAPSHVPESRLARALNSSSLLLAPRRR